MMGDGWGQGVWLALVDLGQRLGAIVPRLLIMLTLIALGLVAGWLTRLVLTRVARAVAFDRHMDRWGLGASARHAGLVRRPSELIGVLGFWVVFVLFASVAVDSLAIPGSGATAILLGLLPAVFTALLILLVGWLIANFVSRGLLIAAVNAGLPEARLLARAAHWSIFLFAVAMALTHAGIAKEMILTAFGITFGGVVLALAIAFGLGGRGLARAILERRLRRERPPARESLTHL